MQGNNSCLTADMAPAECSNTLPDRSNGQPNQLRYAMVAWGHLFILDI